MQSFELNALLAERGQAKKPWLEFLRTPSLSMGVYHLMANQIDPQRRITAGAEASGAGRSLLSRS